MPRKPLGETPRKRIALTLDASLVTWASQTYPDLSISQVVNMALRGVREGKTFLPSNG